MSWRRGEDEDWVGGGEKMRIGLRRGEDEDWVGGEEKMRFGLEETMRIGL